MIVMVITVAEKTISSNRSGELTGTVNLVIAETALALDEGVRGIMVVQVVAITTGFLLAVMDRLGHQVILRLVVRKTSVTSVVKRAVVLLDRRFGIVLDLELDLSARNGAIPMGRP